MPDKADYAWYKAHHICTQCQKQTARKGKVTCLQCSGAAIETSLTYWHDMPDEKKQAKLERRRQYNKRRRDSLKQAGICTMCGKKPAKQGRTLCQTCANKNKMRVAACTRKKLESQGKDSTPRAMRTSLGKCYICGEPVSDESRNFCAGCLEVQRRKAAHMRAFIDHENHPFRALNDAFWREKGAKKNA